MNNQNPNRIGLGEIVLAILAIIGFLIARGT